MDVSKSQVIMYSFKCKFPSPKAYIGGEGAAVIIVPKSQEK